LATVAIKLHRLAVSFQKQRIQKRKGPAMNRAFLFQLLLLLAFGVRLIAMLVGGLRMLLCTLGVFLALGMIALAMMFRRRAMRFRSVFVMFGCLVVFVTSHFMFPVVCSQPQPSHVPDNGSSA
jgi:hypothetical protein